MAAMPLITIITHSSMAASDWKRRSEKITHMMMPAIRVSAVKLMAMPVVAMARRTASRSSPHLAISSRMRSIM